MIGPNIYNTPDDPLRVGDEDYQPWPGYKEESPFYDSEEEAEMERDYE